MRTLDEINAEYETRKNFYALSRELSARVKAGEISADDMIEQLETFDREQS